MVASILSVQEPAEILELAIVVAALPETRHTSRVITLVDFVQLVVQAAVIGVVQ